MSLLTNAEVKAHGFRAFCRLAKPHVIQDMAQYERREAEVRGWRRATRNVYRPKLRRELLVDVFLEPLCDGFETTDRVLFEEHMKTVHGKRTVYGEAENWSKSIRRGWVSPKAKPEGTPLNKTLAAQVKTCPHGCGLVADRPQG